MICCIYNCFNLYFQQCLFAGFVLRLRMLRLLKEILLRFTQRSWLTHIAWEEKLLKKYGPCKLVSWLMLAKTCLI